MKIIYPIRVASRRGARGPLVPDDRAATWRPCVASARRGVFSFAVAAWPFLLLVGFGALLSGWRP